MLKFLDNVFVTIDRNDVLSLKLECRDENPDPSYYTSEGYLWVSDVNFDVTINAKTYLVGNDLITIN